MNGFNIFLKKKNQSQVGDVLSAKAQALLDYKLADLKVIYTTFDEGLQKRSLQVLLVLNFYTTILRPFTIVTRLEISEVTMELLFNMYEEISEKFDI